MASVAVRKQVMMTVWAEAFVDMLWAQRFEGRKHNAVFMGMRERLIRQCELIANILTREPNGRLNEREREKLSKAVGDLKCQSFKGGFTPMMALSFIIDQIIEQLTHVGRNKVKKKAFEGLLFRIKEFERYFDRTKTYEDPAGMEAAEAFRALEI
jgi:hypothetical protein